VLSTIHLDLNDRNESSSSSSATQQLAHLETHHSEFDFVNRPHSVFSAGRSAREKLEESARLPPIVTFCASLDDVLGGGVPLGRMTEFCGLPGVGKTQLGMQLAINTFIPGEFDGCDGHSLYIDTEGSFVPSRAMELVNGLVRHMNALTDGEDGAAKLNDETIAQHLHCYRVHNYIEQLALIGQLKDIVKKLNDEQMPNGIGGGGGGKAIRCVVIDSITFHFRAADQFPDLSTRNRLLSKMASELSDLATSMNLAVIVMNQMTTKPGAGVVPALGDVWGHHPSTRVILEADAIENKRKAILVKSSSRPHATAWYQITQDGIRGCED